MLSFAPLFALGCSGGPVGGREMGHFPEFQRALQNEAGSSFVTTSFKNKNGSIIIHYHIFPKGLAPCTPTRRPGTACLDARSSRADDASIIAGRRLLPCPFRALNRCLRAVLCRRRPGGGAQLSASAGPAAHCRGSYARQSPEVGIPSLTFLGHAQPTSAEPSAVPPAPSLRA